MKKTTYPLQMARKTFVNIDYGIKEFLFLSIVLFSQFLIVFNGGVARATEFKIKVYNIVHLNEGKLMVYVCNNKTCHNNIRAIQTEKRFNELFKREFVEVNHANQIELTIPNIPAGDYSVFVLHDRNNDDTQKFRTFMGQETTPIEPYGINDTHTLGYFPEFENIAINATGNQDTVDVPIELLEFPDFF